MRKLLISSIATAALVFAAPAAFAQSTESQQNQTEPRKTPERAAPDHAAPQRGSQLDRRDQSEESGANPKRDGSEAAQEDSGERKGATPRSMKKGATAGKESTQEKRQGTKAAEQKPGQGAPGKERKGQTAREKEGGPAGATREKGAEAERSKGAQSRENSAEQRSGAQQPGRAADASRPDISQDKQNRIRRAIRKEHVENVTDADFEVNVGTIIPPRYHFYPLPADIAGIVPEYRGYDYMVVNDDIVIVEPQTHRIVYTMSESRSASLDRPGCR